MYFNANDVLSNSDGKNVTDSYECTGNESHYEECQSTKVSRRKEVTDKVSGIFCGGSPPING